jgi:hypothetical protein
MKTRFKKIASITVAIAFLMSCVSCAAGKQMPVKSANDVERPVVEDKEKYVIRFKGGEKYKVRGEDLIVRGDQVGIRFDDEEDFRFYPRNQIEEVATKRKSRWLLGAAIGAPVGAGLGVGMALTGKCSGDEGSSSDCDGMRNVAILLFGGLGAMAGFGIGAAIGAAIKKEKKVIIAPQVNHHNGNTTAGLGISGRF